MTMTFLPSINVAGARHDRTSGVRDDMRANERQREQHPSAACVAGER
jgi:hypothetical protein